MAECGWTPEFARELCLVFGSALMAGLRVFADHPDAAPRPLPHQVNR